jgi:hypothetical protein
MYTIIIALSLVSFGCAQTIDNNRKTLKTEEKESNLLTRLEDVEKKLPLILKHELDKNSKKEVIIAMEKEIEELSQVITHGTPLYQKLLNVKTALGHHSKEINEIKRQS